MKSLKLDEMTVTEIFEMFYNLKVGRERILENLSYITCHEHRQFVFETARLMKNEIVYILNYLHDNYK